MSIKWGVDSAGPSQDLYQRVANQLAHPDFWGRYLCQIAGISSGVTADEVAFLRRNNTATLLVYNATSAGLVASSYDAGKGSGEDAVRLAQGIGCPKGVALYADIENAWSPSPDWMGGYMDALHAGGYLPAFYLNTQNQAHTWAYQQTRKATAAPNCVVWTSEPELNGWADTVRTDFTPTYMPEHEAETVVHQYWIETWQGAIDLDNASEAGFATMWGATPPTPPTPKPQTWRVVTPGTLKSQPSHASSPAIGPNKQPVYLEVGAQITPTGNTKHTDDNWTELRLVRPEAVVHGWFPSGYLRAT